MAVVSYYLCSFGECQGRKDLCDCATVRNVGMRFLRPEFVDMDMANIA